MTSRGALILTRPVRPRVVVKFLAQLCLPLAVVVLVPLAVAVADGQIAFAWRCAALAVVVGGGAWALGRRPGGDEVQTNEALAVIALAFLVHALAVAWLFAGFGIPALDALFEAVSAVTTTGLTTLDDVAGRPASFLFARAWVQWYGGLLIVVLALALLLPPGAAAKRFAESEMGPEDVVGSTRTRARQVLVVYVALTLLGLAAVIAAGAAPEDAVLHVLTAVSTGGFSSRGDSIAGFPWPLQATLMLLALLGAVSFSLYQRLRLTGARALVRDAELWALLAACALSGLLVAMSMTLAGEQPASAVAWRGPLVALSAQTTTGFEALPVAELDAAPKLVLVASMLVGGHAGSTAGGIKVLRLLLLLRLLQLALLRTAVPRHAVTPLRVAGRTYGREEVQAMGAVVLLFLVTVLVSWWIFLAYGVAPLDALFEVVSAICTAGLSAGVAAPGLDPALKLVLALDMWMGRLEVVAVLVLLYPRTWIRPKGA